MNPNRSLWIVLAVALAIPIVALAVSLWCGAPAAAAPRVPAPAVAPAGPEVVAPHVSESAETRVEAPLPAVIEGGQAGASEASSGALVYGAVRMIDGARVPGSLSLSLVRGGVSKPLYNSYLNAGQQQFAWPDVAPGDYELRARAPGVREYTCALEVAPGVREMRVDVVLEPSWIVKVLLQSPDGRPLHENVAQRRKAQTRGPWRLEDSLVVIALWHEIPSKLPTSELRNTPMTVARWMPSRGIEAMRGAVSLPARYAGTLEMPERKDAHVAVVLKEVVLTTATLTAGQEELSITVDPAAIDNCLATLRGQVVDRDGKPLPAARAGINDAQSWRQPGAVDADGRFELTGLLPGEFQLALACDGHASPMFTIALSPGSITDLGTIVLPPQRDLRIEVRDAPEGDGLRGWLESLDAPPHGSLRVRSARLTLRQGAATLQVAEGRYRLRLSGAGGALLDFDTRTLGEGPLVVTLQPEATIDFDPSGTAGPTHLVVRAPSGAVVLDRWVTWRGRWQQSVLPGTYSVTVEPLLGAAREQQLVVGPGGAAFSL
ncbi:MAG: carboxypeptidase regulatory-like domain-containing protein [Planctomycetes bacterium]|nr:carboxypeptidase regulatory-like domain-containing protein [Planctomycetota bacterium]